MKDHIVDEKFNLPGACYIEMALQAAEVDQPTKKVKKLINNYWLIPLSSLGNEITAHIKLTEQDNQSHYDVITYDQNGKAIIHAIGDIIYTSRSTPKEEFNYINISEIKNRCHIIKYPSEVYPQIIAEGLYIGPSLMPMQEIALNQHEALAELRLPEIPFSTSSEYFIHPSLLTGVFSNSF